MDLFEECKNKLENNYKILDVNAEKLVLNKLNAYDTPIFSTSLILALDNFEDIVALSNTVFLYNENYIGTFTNSSPNIMFGMLKQTT